VARLRDRDDSVDLEPFDRTEATWRRLGAPAALYDEAAAAAAWRAKAPRGYRLDDLGDIVFDEVAVRRFCAQRWWSWSRPAFLAAANALTADERRRLSEHPRRYAEPPWAAMAAAGPLTSVDRERGPLTKC
jgi:hypothetical protein